MRTLLLLLLTLPLIAMAHNKSDVVEMYNGDRITGEIMGMVNGDLKINPRYSPPINLDCSTLPASTLTITTRS